MLRTGYDRAGLCTEARLGTRKPAAGAELVDLCCIKHMLTLIKHQCGVLLRISGMCSSVLHGGTAASSYSSSW